MVSLCDSRHPRIAFYCEECPLCKSEYWKMRQADKIEELEYKLNKIKFLIADVALKEMEKKLKQT